MNDEHERKPSTRERILYFGAKLTAGDRNKTYGEPVRNMQDIAALWSTYIDRKMVNATRLGGVQLTGEDVAQLMTLLKIARTMSGTMSTDNYIDGAVYMAIAGECAENERYVDEDD